ncbi:hypothetical protein PSTT_04631 [Puccinia striiformis]|uniref:Uncharacterized protein n=1 Tax=Puccinia striiformis TaxID=27350 RepID=A0A2S4VRX4_9BASI|nr:hypothetical protein PSTT_04631 [Puccinia striiformis]
MSQPFSFSQISTSNTNNNNNINNDHGTINFDQLPNTDPAAVYSTSTLELGFQPAHLIKFALLLLAFLFIPILSTNNPFPTVGHNSRKSSSRSSHRRRRQARRQMPASYQPPQSVVDARSYLYLPEDISESLTWQFRLIFGKRLRGEEEEFKGPSAMKGTRLSTRTQSTHPSLTSSSTFNHKDNNHSQPKTDNHKANPLLTRELSVCRHYTGLYPPNLNSDRLKSQLPQLSSQVTHPFFLLLPQTYLPSF